jgi:hypothetical protein
MRRARTIRIYNGLLPSKFTDDLRARGADDAKLTASLLGGTVARTNLYRNLIWRQAGGLAPLLLIVLDQLKYVLRVS